MKKKMLSMLLCAAMFTSILSGCAISTTKESDDSGTESTEGTEGSDKTEGTEGPDKTEGAEGSDNTGGTDSAGE